MKIIGIGDLVTDYYFVNDEFKGICGGMTSFNIIAHLANEFETYAYGVCGNDFEGNIATKSLEALGVNTSNIIVKDIPTRRFFVSIKNESDFEMKSKKSCPICGDKRWYDDTKVPENIPKKLLDSDNVVIIDTISKVNLNIVSKFNKVGAKVLIDIGQIGNFKYLTLAELKEKLSNKFNVVQLNERVAIFLYNKFKLNSYKELQQIFNSELITITHGKKGATFIYNDKEVFFETNSISKEYDPSGAGDSFYSEIIRAYIKNKFIIDDNMIREAYNSAAKLSSKVVTVLGARGTLEELYNKEIKKDECICGCNNKNTDIKRTRKKALVNISNLYNRVTRAMESEAYNQIKLDIEENVKNGTCAFLGSGGSRAAACLAAKVVNELYSNTTLFLNPRDMMYRNNKDIKNVYAFSYSGTSPDIVYVLNNLDTRCTIITKQKEEKVKLKYINPDVNVISYCNALHAQGRERVFLSFEGTVAPATLFAKLYFDSKNNNLSFEEFVLNRFEYWKEYFDKYFKENKKELSRALEKKNVIDVFYGDNVDTASFDLESKLTESGIYRIDMHEKKNFSHGRFIVNEHFCSDAIIYLKTSKKDNYEEKLINYLNKNSNMVITIESQYEGLMAEYDLLIAVQYFVANISKLLNVDLSKPDYTEDSMVIYKYSGKL